MQILKSLFIVFFPLLCLFGLFLSYDQYIHGYVIASIGLLLVSIPMLVFLGTLYLLQIARTDSNLKPYSFIVIIGTLLLCFAFIISDAEWFAGLGFILSVFWFLYVYWYSSFGERENQLLTKGQSLVELYFEDENGTKLSSKSFLTGPSILMFYRGNWCPLCMAQIKELVEQYKLLESKGIRTFLISPQPHTHTKKLAEKFKVGFSFLVDKDNSVARKLNIISENGLPFGMQVLGYDSDTVMPTILLLDKNGKILHSDLTANYRVRPEPSELIKYFE